MVMIASAERRLPPPNDMDDYFAAVEILDDEITERYEDIIAGAHMTNPDFMFQPMLPALHCNCWREEGVIGDPVMRELFSFSRELAEQASQVRWAKHPDQLRQRRMLRSFLYDQSLYMQRYFWRKMRIAFPSIRRMKRGDIHLCWGWKVMIRHRHHKPIPKHSHH